MVFDRGIFCRNKTNAAWLRASAWTQSWWYIHIPTGVDVKRERVVELRKGRLEISRKILCVSHTSFLVSVVRQTPSSEGNRSTHQ